MATDTNWGFGAGFARGQEDLQQKNLYQIQMAEGQQALALGSLNLEKQSLALTQAKDALARQTSADAMIKAAMAKHQSTGDPMMDLTDSLFITANAKLASGLPEEGGEIAAKAITIQKNRADMAGKLLQTSEEKYGLAAQIFGSVPTVEEVGLEKSNAAKADALMRYQAVVGEPLDPKLSARPMTNQWRKAIVDSSMTQLDKAKIAAEKAEVQLRQAEAHNQNVDAELRKAQTEQERVRTRLLEKNGGLGALPTKQELDAAARAIQAAIPEADKQGAADFAPEVTERAKELVQQGQSAPAAFRKAVSEMQTAGKFDKIKLNAKAQAQTAAVDTSLETLDRVIETLEKSKGSLFTPVGAVGMASRVKETAESLIPGRKPSTTAHQFESDVSELRLLLPQALGISPARYKQLETNKVVPGLELGNNIPGALAQFRRLKQTLLERKSGGRPQFTIEPDQQPASAPAAGKVMTPEEALEYYGIGPGK